MGRGRYISIHALHEESDLDGAEFGAFGIISIHALHEESDMIAQTARDRTIISIHALHEESDARCCVYPWSPSYFNPRSP